MKRTANFFPRFHIIPFSRELCACTTTLNNIDKSKTKMLR